MCVITSGSILYQAEFLEITILLITPQQHILRALGLQYDDELILKYKARIKNELVIRL